MYIYSVREIQHLLHKSVTLCQITCRTVQDFSKCLNLSLLQTDEQISAALCLTIAMQPTVKNSLCVWVDIGKVNTDN